MYSEITIIGNAGSDIETKSTTTGKLVGKLSVAVSVGWGDKKTTEWYKCDLWEKMAENAGKMITKGSIVLISGTLSHPIWKGKDGVERATPTISVKEWRLLGGGKPKDNSQGGQPQYSNNSQGSHVQQEDVPF